MKLQEIYEFTKSIVDICTKKVKEASENNLPQDLQEYEMGRLFEANYIHNKVTEIIFKDEEIK